MSLIEDIKAKVLELHEEAKAKKSWTTDVRWYDVIEELELDEIEDEIVGESRWMVQRSIVVGRDGEYVRINHESGATEMQDNNGAQDELDSLEEVEPVEKTVIVYVRKKS